MEHLRYDEVVNIDVDPDVLALMRRRWERKHGETKSMKWHRVDFSRPDGFFRDLYPERRFDLVVDKGALDAALCAEVDAPVGLVSLAYRSLATGGVYAVITLHGVEFMLALLRGCGDAGVDWEVSCERVERRASVISSLYGEEVYDEGLIASRGSGTESVNVFFCRKRSHNALVDTNKLRCHICSASDDWFRSRNPMMTPDRISQLRDDFECHGKRLVLKRCYEIMFTDVERSDLTFEDFLEDWTAFCEDRRLDDKDGMDVHIAIEFLTAMQ